MSIMNKSAKANVSPIRQRTQYTCMSASLAMCLKANGLDYDEDTVNKVMGAKPMQGASWEQAFAAAQHFGQRVTMIIPATLKQVKEYTDRGVPVMIAWNPEGRPWSHASVVFDVTDDGMVHVADPNIPDPDETVRIVTKDDFYHKWFEQWPDYLVRRPALAIEREVSVEGRQMVASARRASEVYVDKPVQGGKLAALGGPLSLRPDYGSRDAAGDEDFESVHVVAKKLGVKPEAIYDLVQQRPQKISVGSVRRPGRLGMIIAVKLSEVREALGLSRVAALADRWLQRR